MGELRGTNLVRCASDPRRACRAKGRGACARCFADHHNPQLHRLHRLAHERGVPYDVVKRELEEGRHDG